MKQYLDSKNRTWNVEVNVATIKRIRDLCEFNILEDTGEKLKSLSSNPCLLADVLYAIVKPQADTQNISDADFAEGLSGDTIENATNAFLEELVNFFPNRKAKILQTALQKAKQAEDILIQSELKKMENLNPEILSQEFMKSPVTSE